MFRWRRNKRLVRAVALVIATAMVLFYVLAFFPSVS